MIVIALALAASHSASLPAICRDVKPYPVDAVQGAQLRRLDKLPKGEGYLTVMRTENGCIRPAKISEERARPR